MSLLKSLLLDKKFMEAMEEVDAFIEKEGIEPGSIAQRLEFDKKIFKDQDQVQDFLDAHVFSEHRPEDQEKQFIVTLFEEIGFVESTLKKVTIRDGVSMTVGILKPMSADNPLLFGAKDSETIKLSSDIPYVIALATTVNGFHMNFGEVQITKADLVSFKDNFMNNVVGVDLSIDFDHETREAAGWIKEVFLSEDGETLFGAIRWTPKGAVALTDREFRYLSPEFHPNWVHPHTGVAHGPTMLGAALVNRPFLKMDAIVGLNNKKKGVPTMETIALSEHNQKVVDLQKQIDSIRLSEETAVKTAKNLQEKVKSLSEETKTLKDTAAKKEREDKRNKLFNEGKINKAQLTALNEGKDMFDVLLLSENMNGKPAGSGDADNSGGVKLSDSEKAMCKKMGQTEDEFIKYNYGGAI